MILRCISHSTISLTEAMNELMLANTTKSIVYLYIWGNIVQSHVFISFFIHFHRLVFWISLRKSREQLFSYWRQNWFGGKTHKQECKCVNIQQNNAKLWNSPFPQIKKNLSSNLVKYEHTTANIVQNVSAASDWALNCLRISEQSKYCCAWMHLHCQGFEKRSRSTFR